MFSFTAFLISVAAINLLSCGAGTIESKDIASTSTYRSYTLDYDLDKNELDAYARFSTGGPNETSVILTDPAMVMVNAKRLQVSDGRTRKINLNGTYYRQSYELKSIPAYARVTWIDDEQRKTLDVVDFPKAFLLALSTELDEISKDQDLILSVGSAELQDDEKWQLTLESKASSSSEDSEEETYHSQTFNDNDLTIAAKDIEDFRVGQATITLSKVRVQRKGKSEQNAGALITSKVTRKLEFKIVE
jgi:hypothetical protein